MSHLTEDKRLELYALRKEGCTQQSIALQLDVNQSSISRELSRNSAGPRLGYLPDRAHKRAKRRRKEARESLDAWYDDRELLDYVVSNLTGKEYWSPEQIAGRLKKECPQDPSRWVSHTAIYAYIRMDRNHGGDLFLSLRNRGKKPHKRGKKDARGVIPNRRDIKDRPHEVAGKKVVGHSESDLVIGKQTDTTAILTIVERKTKKTFGGKVRRTARGVANKVIRTLSHLPPALRKTMTHDNGKEISLHETITEKIQMPVFCATPYHSWERGLNEYTNRLLRQYFPKGISIDTIPAREIQSAIDALNNRPRKILNYRTPNEAFEEELQIMRFKV